MRICNNEKFFFLSRIWFFVSVIMIIVFAAFLQGTAFSSVQDSLSIKNIPESNIIISNLTLDEDRRMEGDVLLSGGTLNLNGHFLFISGTLYQSGGNMNPAGGILEIQADYRIQGFPEEDGAEYTDSQGTLSMTNDEDIVLVHGDFITQSRHSHSNRLTKGLLEVRGDFIQKEGHAHNFNATGTHKVVLAGQKKQNVFFTSPAQSGFSACSIRNDKVYFPTSIRGWKLEDDAKINITQEEVFKGFTGTMDLNGKKLVIRQGFTPEHAHTLNLTGGELSIEGDFFQPVGTVNVNSGTLVVQGDYLIKGLPQDGGAEYTDSQGTLSMTDDQDIVLVHGDFITQSRHSHSNRLTKGVLEVRGDFIQKEGHAHNFNATGTHKVVLAGQKKQNVFFTSPAQSGFAACSIRSDQVYFPTSIRGWKLEEDAAINITQGKAFKGFTGTMDLNGKKLVIRQGFTPEHAHTLNLAGGELIIGGDFFQSVGTVNVNSGTLVVQGDYRMQGLPEDGGAEYTDSQGTLSMTDDQDIVLVHGDFITQSRHSHSNRLTKGVLEVRGDFIQKEGHAHNFNATGTHKVVLAGQKKQNVFFTSPAQSGFSACSIRNDKVYFPTSIRGWKLEEDAAINITQGKAFKGFTGTMDLNGKKLVIRQGFIPEHAHTLNLTGGELSIEGDFIQPVGTVNLNSGTLVVQGDYRIQGLPEEDGAEYTDSQGTLSMTDDEDIVLVHGDFITQSRHSHSNRLTKGVLEVRGDFIQKTGHNHNFNATGTHKVVLAEQKKQNVSFASPAQSGFQIVILVNDQEDRIVFPQDYRARNTVQATRTLDHLQLAVGETADIQASIDFPGHQVTWKSLEPEISLVSSSGSVKGENEGTTRIKASSLADPDIFLYTWVEVVHDPIAPDLAEAPEEHVHVGELEGMDRITVRALRGWGHLPPKFDRLALDLRGKGVDILGYDLSQVQDLANQAKEPDSPLQAQGADLKELAEFMAGFLFTQPEIQVQDKKSIDETTTPIADAMPFTLSLPDHWLVISYPEGDIFARLGDGAAPLSFISIGAWDVHQDPEFQKEVIDSFEQTVAGQSTELYISQFYEQIWEKNYQSWSFVLNLDGLPWSFILAQQIDTEPSLEAIFKMLIDNLAMGKDMER